MPLREEVSTAAVYDDPDSVEPVPDASPPGRTGLQLTYGRTCLADSPSSIAAKFALQ